MLRFDIYLWAANSTYSQGLNSTLGRGVIFISLTNCHFHVYIIHVYNFLSSPITQYVRKRVCYFYLLI